MSKKNENINEEVKNAEETAEDIKDTETKEEASKETEETKEATADDKIAELEASLSLIHIQMCIRDSIDDKSLIAGNQATKNKNAPIFPEYTMEFVMNELDLFEKRDGDVFYITAVSYTHLDVYKRQENDRCSECWSSDN